MRALLLAGTVLAAARVSAVLWRTLPAHPRTDQRPLRSDVSASLTVPWVAAAALGGAAALAPRNRPSTTAGMVGVVTFALVSPAGTRAAVHAIGRLQRFAVGQASRNAYTRAYIASHAAYAYSAKQRNAAIHAEQAAALFATEKRALDAALSQMLVAADRERKYDDELRPIVDAVHDELGHAYAKYNNLLDGVRLWHNAQIEWLALTVTLLARAGLVAGARRLPRELTAGVTPRGAAALPWSALTGWSGVLALAAPTVATRTMERNPHEITRALVIESALLAVTLLATPNWAVLASVSTVWNCANRLPSGFSWTGKVPAVTSAVVAVCWGSLVFHGANPRAAFLETALGVGLGAIISNSFTVFAPGSAYVITVLPARVAWARRASRKAMAPHQHDAEAALATYRSAAEAARAQHPDAAEVALTTALLVGLALDQRAPELLGPVADDFDRIVRTNLRGSSLTFSGTRAGDGLDGARWEAPDGLKAAWLASAVGVTAAEARAHGADGFELALTRNGDEIRLTATTARRAHEPGPAGGGAAILNSLINAIGGRLLANDPSGAGWKVEFAVPATMLVAP